jgi:hypothetical protein
MISSAELKANSSSTMVLINSDGMGSAEDPLRQKLVRLYLTMLQENEFYPGAIGIYADGVKLVIEGSPVLDLLKALESKGVRLIICSTCLQYYGLADKVAAGIVGGMNDIVLAQWMANKVITI